MSSEDTHLNVKVEQVTKGVPSYKTVTFTYNGIKSPPVRVDVEAAQVNRWCHSSVTQTLHAMVMIVVQSALAI